VTIVPNITLSVATAIAVSVIHGSATARIGSRHRTWSQTKTSCHPLLRLRGQVHDRAGIGELLDSGNHRPERMSLRKVTM
jgi:hypothetical protein